MKNLKNKVKLRFVYQETPKGLANAILLTKKYIKEDDKKRLSSHLKSLELYLKKISDDIVSSFEGIKIISPLSLAQPVVLQTGKNEPEFAQETPGFSLREVEEEDEEGKKASEEEFHVLEKEGLKRFKKKEEKII